MILLGFTANIVLKNTDGYVKINLLYYCFMKGNETMIYSKIVFSDIFNNAYIEAYIHDPHEELKVSKRRAMIVCPGGGYSWLSEREAEPVALQYLAEGLNVFVLRYSVREKAADYAPLIEACLAIKYIREHCDELYVDPKYVFVTGFSAGGHLAAWVGTMWHIPEVQAYLNGADPEICKPTATLPCYAVITSKPGVRHGGSIINLNGGNADEEGMARFSLENFVDERTSPSFLWHTATDTCVPVMNSIIYAAALSEHKIPFELHIFPYGPHGLSVCNKETWVNNPELDNPYAAQWLPMALRWVRECPFEK